MLYKVLKPGIHQRNPEGGFTTPKVGDIIKVSDIAAPRLIEKGFIERAGVGAVEPVHDSRRERRKKWLATMGGGGEKVEEAKDETTSPTEGEVS